MPDTPEIAAIRADLAKYPDPHRGSPHDPIVYARALIAHLDALTATVASSAIWHDFKAEGADPALVEDIRTAVLVIIKGEER